MQHKRVAELVKLYLNGNENAFDRIYSSLYSGQYYYAYKIVRDKGIAEDLVQEAFIKAYKNIRTIRDPKTFVKWLTMITYHECMDYIKQQRGNELQVNDVAEYVSGYADEEAEWLKVSDPEKETVGNERKKGIRTAVDSLDPEFSSVVLLRYYMDFSNEEIADILGIPVGTVKSRLNKSRQRLSLRLNRFFSVMPFFWVSAFLRKEAFSVTAASGLAYRGSAAKTAAVTTFVVGGLTAGIFGLMRDQNPVITDISLPDYAKAVPEQAVDVKAESCSGIRRLFLLENGKELTQDKDTYTAVVDENGTWTVVAEGNDGNRTSQTFEVSNIDRIVPEVKTEKTDGRELMLEISDRGSGIDWEKLKITDADGKEITPESIDREKGRVLCAVTGTGPEEVTARDHAGNWRNIRIRYE